MVGLMNPDAQRLARWGYAVWNVDYRAGARSMRDVVHFYDELRAKVGAGPSICAYGASSGGHLALMLAERRRRLRCVIAEAPPTLLRRLPQPVLGFARRAFRTHGGLDRWSPARRRLRTPVLLGHALRDPYVPFAQSKYLKVRAPRTTRLRRLRRGRTPWIHTRVRAADVRAWHRSQRSFLARATASR
jgi:dipeptidyl aminopeptidase/acylaminoacyl peptidase